MVSETTHSTAGMMEMQDGEPRSRKISRTRIAVTIILGTLILGFVILGSVLLTGQPMPVMNGATPAAIHRNIRGFELEEIIHGILSPRHFNGTFISGTEIVYRSQYGDLNIYDVVTKNVQTLISATNPVLRNAVTHEISADRKYILIGKAVQKLYRHSYIANYEILNIETKEITPLTSSDGHRLHLLALWSPVNNAIAFVAHNTHDLYYKASVEAPAQRVTKSGVLGVVYNGVPDWVNEEDMLGTNKAMWFSTDGSKLGFIRYNDTLTRIMSIPYYGVPGRLDFQYTRAVNIRYPKPGTPNPEVSLHVALLGETETTVLDMPAPSELTEPLIAAVVWGNSDEMYTFWMNRVQNISYMQQCTPAKTSCRNVLDMKEPRGWISIVSEPTFAANGTKVALVLPQKQESGGEFRHIAIGQLGSNGEFMFKALTKGTFTVTQILHFDGNTVHYLGIEQEYPEVQHLYKASLDDEIPYCLSCAVKTKLQKKPCLSNSADFSVTGDFYVLSCEGPGVPEITIRNQENQKVKTWEDNRHIYEDVRSRQLPIIERSKVKVPGGFNAAVAVYLPPDIDRSGSTSYPVLVHVYGGPDSSLQNEKFSIDWSTYLAVNRSIIYVYIDGRGSGNKGNDILFSVYRSLGIYEIQDQIQVTKAIQKKYPFMDKKRTAIWGWSYGGYATTMALAQDTGDVFKCGMAVAPVSDWALYDTLYAEKFMGLPTPTDNLKGYAMAQLFDKVENLRRKKYLLIHGTLDDNVHYQHSMLLAKVLEQKDILFRQQSYPDEDHGLAQVRPHLYHTLESFLDECYE